MCSPTRLVPGIVRRMAERRRDDTWRVLWKSKWLVAAIVVVVAGTTAVLSKLQTPVYVADAKLIVSQPAQQGGGFDSQRASEAFARTLNELIRSENVAQLVRPRLSFPVEAREALGKMSFAPVNETQLIEISAEDTVPVRAQELANVWAAAFVEYATRTLANTSPSKVSIADLAVLPQQPSRPKPTLYTAVAFVLGLSAAVGFVLIRNRLDTRVDDIDTLAEEFGVPVLATIPRRGKSANAGERFEEAVRVLRTSLQFATDLPLRAIAVTSAGEGEGKSTITAELARSFALLALVDQAVLAVDADLRRPTLHARLGFEEKDRGSRGLSNYLLGQATFDACVRETDLSALRLLSAGALPPNPSTMLGFAASREALGRLRERAEVVIVDTPPVAAGADASIVATEMDGVVLVIDLAKSRRDDIRATLDQMRRVNALVLGFVVNRVTLADRIAAGYYYTANPEGANAPGGPLRLLRRGRPAPSRSMVDAEIPAAEPEPERQSADQQ